MTLTQIDFPPHPSFHYISGSYSLRRHLRSFVRTFARTLTARARRLSVPLSVRPTPPLLFHNRLLHGRV